MMAKKLRYRIAILTLIFVTMWIIHAVYIRQGETDLHYWTRQWQSGIPSRRAKALRWFTQNYLRPELREDEVVEVLGWGDFAMAENGNFHSYKEAQSGTRLELWFIELKLAERDEDYYLAGCELRKGKKIPIWGDLPDWRTLRW